MFQRVHFLILATAALIVGLAVHAVLGREAILAHGQIALFELVPVDPRSLMQGDYMALRYAVDEALLRWEDEHGSPARFAVLEVDDKQRASLRALSETRPQGEGLVVRIRASRGQPSVGPNAFFFAEGQAEAFAGARWGEFRIGADGSVLLTHLRDRDLRRLGEQRR